MKRTKIFTILLISYLIFAPFQTHSLMKSDGLSGSNSSKNNFMDSKTNLERNNNAEGQKNRYSESSASSQRRIIDPMVEELRLIEENRNRENSQLSLNGLPSDPIGIETNADTTLIYNETHQISGILKGAGGQPWGDETVTLHRNGSGILATDTTDSVTGQFQFDLTFTSADIGLWNYTVEFAGTPPFRQAGTVLSELVQIQDAVSIAVSVDLTNIGNGTIYTVTFTASSLSGNLVNDGIEVSYTEIYGISNGAEENSFATINSETGGYSSTYGHIDNWAGATTDTINFNFGVNNPTAFPQYAIEINPPIPEITVTSGYGFTMVSTIDGSSFNAGTRYYRNSQIIQLVLNVTSYDPTATLGEIQTAVGFAEYDVVVSGADSESQIFTSAVDGNLNFNGSTEITFNLDETNFPNMNLAQNTQITVSVTIGNVTNLSTDTQSFNFKLKEDLGYIDVTTNTIDDDAFYYPSVGSSITISGKVYDDATSVKPAAFVPLVLVIKNDPLTTNPANIHQFPSTIITDGNGDFTFIVSSFSFPIAAGAYMYLNITLGTISNSDWVTPPPFPSAMTYQDRFKYFSDITEQFFISLDGVGEIPFTTGTINIFNGSLADLMVNGSYIRLVLLDEFGRAPNGFEISVSRPNIAGITDTVSNASNNGVFTILLNTIFAGVPDLTFPNDDASFQFTATTSNGIPTFSVSRSRTYVVFGPDEAVPTYKSFSITGNNTGNEDPVNIQFQIDGGLNAQTNIRNITIQYRYSNSLVPSNPTYNPQYIEDVMNYNSGNGIATYTFSFDDHGRWIEFFIVIQDWAGNGTDQNGLTFNPAMYSDPDFTHNVTLPTYEVLMGDTTIDLSWSNNLPQFVYINGTSMAASTSTNLTIGENLRVNLYVPIDNGDTPGGGTKGYGFVTINWKILTYDKFGALVNDPGIFTQTNMSLAQVNQVATPIVNTWKYEFIIEGGNFTTYFQTIEFFFEVSDIYDNSGLTPSINNFIDNFNVFASMVQDEVAPTTPTKSSTTSASHPPISPTQSEVWNQNETGTFSFTVNDTETGIYSVTVYVYYLLDGEVDPILVSLILVYNGTIDIPSNNTQIPAPLEVYDTGNFTNFGVLVNVTTIGSGYLIDLIIDFSGIWENTTISYSATTEDFSGNTIETNAQDGSETSFYVKNAFVPEFSNTEVSVFTTESVTTIVTTDSDGNTITIVSTSTGLATLFGIDDEDESNNAALVILIFTAIVVGITLWYQRHNIMETFARRARARKVRGTLSELTDEIKRLGAEGQYRKAILLTWEALERVSREIVQAPRSYNQTAREYASFLSTVTIVDRETLLTLSNSFESAKYGKDEPSIDVWDDAIKALEITVLTIIESGARVQLDEDDEEFD